MNSESFDTDSGDRVLVKEQTTSISHPFVVGIGEYMYGFTAADFHALIDAMQRVADRREHVVRDPESWQAVAREGRRHA